MFAFSAALVGLAITYSIALIRFTNGFRSGVAARRPACVDAPPNVSVVIAARNEASEIASCLRSIIRNDYPPQRVSIIVVDDDSEDATADVVRAVTKSDSRVRLVETQAAGTRDIGKRWAIQKGIEATDDEIVLLTDADCIVPKGWIRAMISTFDDTTRFVSGPVAYPSGSTWLGRILEIESLGLVAVGGGAIALGSPNMCNGANVAFTRSAFHEAGGYAGTDSVTSGDDELLMQKIAGLHPGSVAFCSNPEATIETKAPGSLSDLFQQRKRWASKGFAYADKRVTGLAVLVYMFNLMLAIAVVTVLMSGPVAESLTAAFLFKIGAEGWLFWTACGHFGKRYLLPWMIPGQLFIIPYVVVVGAAGTLGGYHWKGRDIRR